jgi:hypothetical protein
LIEIERRHPRAELGLVRRAQDALEILVNIAAKHQNQWAADRCWFAGGGNAIR